ncbi:TRAP transporter small permease subunit [Agrobacterium sp. ES01]|uniref:TRAP transporter small permease subunit n=1 Tax=Agrobacterium sp. ES01 TaxID=3420714 RepID=UPI003D09D6B4
MTFLYRLADGLSSALARLAEAIVLILVASMIYEVVARYVFDAPTVWAFDIAYMATGVLFILGAAQALRENAHIRIDFLASRMPKRLQGMIEGAIMLLGVTPLFAALAFVATTRALRAYSSGEVETVSPWAPLMWPFYAFLALGLAALALQIFANGLRDLLGHHSHKQSGEI